ncbi:MAG: monovalent cation/H+ antiporter subunit D family protein, partial [Lentisphaeria bacterium]|nr:monovalent cation/H+ antiporter subunit D family protein [Lentisphaeria bacterium]
CIYYKTGSLQIKDMKQMFAKMPLTMLAFTLGALSMIGIPPTCGFFSKWYLVSGAMEAGQWGYVIALLFSSLINVILFFRIFEIAFLNTSDDDEHDEAGDHEHHHEEIKINEAPISMLIPTLIISFTLILIGLSNNFIIKIIIEPFVNSKL